MRRRSRRKVAFCAIAALVIAPVIGVLYERRARAADARVFTPVGTMVDVGGHRLHLLCIGSGAPIVLFEASGFSNALSSGNARSQLARHTRVCSYDRVGVGWSDPAPASLTVGMLATDLRQLQDAAGLSPPLVLVTASIGGLISEMFARRYPERVAGLVFLDAATSQGIEQAAQPVSVTQVRIACSAVSAAGAVGLVRLADPFHLRRAAEDARSAALTYGAQPWNALCALVRGFSATMQEFASAPPLRPDIPLFALSAATEEGLVPPALAPWFTPGVGWRVAAHQQFAKQSSRGIWREVQGSSHLIAASQPQAVVDTVLELLEDARR